MLGDGTPVLQGATDQTEIGNIGDTLKVSLHDSLGQALTSTLNSGKRSLDVNITNSIQLTNFPTAVDTNYGTVGASTIRTAAQIGNATGAAAFGAGTTSAQTLRVVLPTDQSSIPVTQSGIWTVQPGNTPNTSPWLVRLHDGTDGSLITANNDLQVADLLNNSGVEGTVTVGTTAVVAKVGGSNLSNRKLLTVHNNSDSIIYWGYTSGVTTSNGTPLYKKQLGSWDVGPNTSIYLIASDAGNVVRVTEGA